MFNRDGEMMLAEQILEIKVLTCMHWYKRETIFDLATKCSICTSKPSANPLSKSNATTIKSLSGISTWSGCIWAAYNAIQEETINGVSKQFHSISVANIADHNPVSLAIMLRDK